MARYVLKDFQAVMRGLRQVAEKSLDRQLTDATLRWKMSSVQPLCQNILLKTQQKSDASPFSLSEVPSRIGAVMQGLQEQVKIMTGLTAPMITTPDGMMLFSKYDKFDKSTQQKKYPAVADKSNESNQQKYPAVAEEAHSAKLGLKQNKGEASEAAKRAEAFMNQPVAPMDPEDKNDVIRGPDMQGNMNGKAANLRPDKSDLAAKRFGKFMNEEMKEEDNTYKKDSVKTTVGLTDNASEAFDAEEVKKVQQTPPGTAVPLNS